MVRAHAYGEFVPSTSRDRGGRNISIGAAITPAGLDWHCQAIDDFAMRVHPAKIEFHNHIGFSTLLEQSASLDNTHFLASPSET